MTSVFISYRHDDGGHVAGRLKDRLARAFGDENVFLDTESLDVGDDFRRVICQTIESCDAVVAVVGPRFHPERLAQADDIVRMELQTALELGKLVVPVLLDDTPMPAPAALPAVLKDFAYRHAAPLRAGRDFATDIDRLINDLRRSSSSDDRVEAEATPALRAAGRWSAVSAGWPTELDRIGNSGLERRFTRYRHGRQVVALATSPDGNLLASGSGDGLIGLWSLRDGSPVAPIETGSGWSLDLAFSPDGGTLGAVDGRTSTVRLWDTTDGGLVRRLGGGDWAALSLAFAPDGMRVLTGGSDGSVRMWDIDTARQVDDLGGHRGPVCEVAFSPDGRLVASASEDRTVVLRSVLADQRARRTVLRHDDPVWALAFSPDGSLVATGAEDGRLRIWRSRNGRRLRVLGGHSGRVTSVAFSGGGRLLARASSDGTVRLWDPQAGSLITSLINHNDGVNAVVFASLGGQPVLACAGGRPDGRGDNLIRIWYLGRPFSG